MILLERFPPRLPAALIVLVGSIAASAWLDLATHGVAVVGDLPFGLALPKLPAVGLESVPLLFVGAAGIALLAFAEAMGPAQQLAKEHGYEVDANRELVAVGAANMGAGLFQGFPIGASLSKSAANRRTLWDRRRHRPVDEPADFRVIVHGPDRSRWSRREGGPVYPDHQARPGGR